jgi:hypothetical protein
VTGVFAHTQAAAMQSGGEAGAFGQHGCAACAGGLAVDIEAHAPTGLRRGKAIAKTTHPTNFVVAFTMPFADFRARIRPRTLDRQLLCNEEQRKPMLRQAAAFHATGCVRPDLGTQLRQNLGNYPPACVGELFVAACVQDAEAILIESHET